MVSSGTVDFRDKEMQTDWPVEEGLEAGTTKTHGRQVNLTPTEGSTVMSRDRTLIG